MKTTILAAVSTAAMLALNANGQAAGGRGAGVGGAAGTGDGGVGGAVPGTGAGGALPYNNPANNNAPYAELGIMAIVPCN